MSTLLSPSPETSQNIDLVSPQVPTFIAGDKILSMGDLVQLRVNAVNSKCYARYIGALNGSSVVLALETEFPEQCFRPNTSVTCKYISDESITFFESRILRFENDPFASLHLAYPSNVERLSAFRDKRIKVALISLLSSRSHPDSHLMTGRVLNLSQGGMYVATKEPVALVGDEINLYLMFPENGQNVKMRIAAKVRHASSRIDESGTRRYFYGVKFQSLGTPNSLIIKSYLFDTLRNSSGSLSH